MAFKTKLTKSPEWWKHLKKFNKRLFWSRERKNTQRDIQNQIKENT